MPNWQGSLTLNSTSSWDRRTVLLTAWLAGASGGGHCRHSPFFAATVASDFARATVYCKELTSSALHRRHRGAHTGSCILVVPEARMYADTESHRFPLRTRLYPGQPCR